MSKITENDKIQYKEKIKTYSETIKTLLKSEKDLLLESKKLTPEAPLKKMILVNQMLNITSNYLAINGISQAVLRLKDEEALNEARKSIYKAIIYLEDAVSNYIDAPFSDYEEKLNALEEFDENQRYALIRKIGLTIDMLEHAYGDNSKWKWSFVDLEGRFAVTAKNMLDLKNVLENSHPDSRYYDATVYHLRLVKELLAQSAARFREKYELSTGQMLDFRTGISFLAALRRIHIVLVESEEAEELKKKLNVWTTKLEMDHKKHEEAKKRLG